MSKPWEYTVAVVRQGRKTQSQTLRHHSRDDFLAVLAQEFPEWVMVCELGKYFDPIDRDSLDLAPNEAVATVYYHTVGDDFEGRHYRVRLRR